MKQATASQEQQAISKATVILNGMAVVNKIKFGHAV